MKTRTLSLAAAIAVGTVAGTASAGAIQYTMTWNSVSGTYGSTVLSDARVTLDFDYDTDDVSALNAAYYMALFTNGAGIRVTLVNNQSGSASTLLNEATLDDVAANSAALATNGDSMIFGTVSGSTYGYDRGGLNGFDSGVSAVDALTTAWSSTSLGFISSPWATNQLEISGLQLSLSVDGNTAGGSWGSTMGSSPAVPGVGGAAALAGLGLAGRRRRR